MLSMDDLRIEQYVGLPPMTQWMRITHVPSGLYVQGCCRQEDQYPRVQTELTNQLSQVVMKEFKGITREAQENIRRDETGAVFQKMQELQRQIDQLKAQR